MPKLCTAGKADEAFIKKLMAVVRDVTSYEGRQKKKQKAYTRRESQRISVQQHGFISLAYI